VFICSYANGRLSSIVDPPFLGTTGDIMAEITPMHGTTILAVRRNGRTAIAGDGQVTVGTTVMNRMQKGAQNVQ